MPLFGDMATGSPACGQSSPKGNTKAPLCLGPRIVLPCCLVNGGYEHSQGKRLLDVSNINWVVFCHPYFSTGLSVLCSCDLALQVHYKGPHLAAVALIQPDLILLELSSPSSHVLHSRGAPGRSASHWSSLRFSPVCSCLSGTGGPRAGPSTPAAAPTLGRGEESPLDLLPLR